MRDASEDWRRFDAGAIPTKESTPHLDAFVSSLRQANPHERLTLLDVGCGGGRLSGRLYAHGFSVLGVDVNQAALHLARGQTVQADAAGRWHSAHQNRPLIGAQNRPPCGGYWVEESSYSVLLARGVIRS